MNDNSFQAGLFRTAILMVAVLSIVGSANPALTPGTFVDISPSWFQKNNNSTTIAGGLAIDPNNPAILYWGVGGFTTGTSVTGLFKSTDAGSTWTHLTPFDNAVSVYVDPRNSQHLYANEGVAGSHLGFWVSNDGGVIWAIPQGLKDLNTSTGYFLYDIYDMAVDPTDFDHVLATSHSAWKWGDAVIGNSSGVLESKDGGNTWTIHMPVNGWGAGHCISFLYDPATGKGDNKTWLLGTQDNGMWRTSDGGATWAQVSTTAITHGGGNVYYAKTGVVYATANTGILRSTNNGITWTSVNPGAYAGYTRILGDGTRLYTSPAYGSGAHPYFTSLETDGINWTPYNSQTFDNGGPYEMVFDKANGILYSSAWFFGLLALKIPDATSTSPVKQEMAGVRKSKTFQRTFDLKNGRLELIQTTGISGNLITGCDIKGRIIIGVR